MSSAGSQDPPHLVVQPDTRPGAGFGHLSRCFSLASAWVATGGRATLLAAQCDTHWLQRYLASGIGIAETVGALGGGQPRWWVLDGYHTTLDDQRAAQHLARHVLVIDDHGSLGTYLADAVLDQNLGAHPALYRHRSTDHAGLPQSPPDLVLGPKFMLLRSEFGGKHRPADGSPVAPTREPARSGALLSGGGQPTPEVSALLAAVEAQLIELGIECRRLAGRAQVAPLMKAAEIGIAAAGGTAYELCAVGTPAVLFSVAANQEPVGRQLADAGAAIFLGPTETFSAEQLTSAAMALLADESRRVEIAEAQQRVVDGRGADRVVALLRSFDVVLRPAGPDDRSRIWEWANEPETRRQSFNSEPIPWQDHCDWFSQQIAHDPPQLYVAEHDGRPIGQARLAVDASGVVVSFSLAPEARGLGLGPLLLIAATRLSQRLHLHLPVIGHVRSDNRASRACFEVAGYDLITTPESADRSGQSVIYRLPASELQ